MNPAKILLLTALAFASTTSVAAKAPIGADDTLGDEWVQNVLKQINNVEAENNKLKKLLLERQTAIAFIKREDQFKYFSVKPGSLRKQLPALIRQAGFTTVRWSDDIPQSCDWQFDNSFKIDVTKPHRATLQYFKGLPITPVLVKRDNSINIEPLSVLPECA
ncbi:hypothetical protein [Photobacterium sp. GB-72]|uniref:hypothetical protein n=1 Tax=Photobacterium sp. GB-72 TaxID=2022105 RepID=UPI000D1581DA|nr:hypothetical protein [Photobacterium sp. GB-72]PSV27661.1 hypothetical protein C9J40_20205 [Photobacterium sp. GB-72]